MGDQFVGSVKMHTNLLTSCRYPSRYVSVIYPNPIYYQIFCKSKTWSLLVKTGHTWPSHVTWSQLITGINNSLRVTTGHTWSPTSWYSTINTVVFPILNQKPGHMVTTSWSHLLFPVTSSYIPTW